MTKITRKEAEDAWRENPPSDEMFQMMRYGAEYIVPILRPISPYVRDHWADEMLTEPSDAPHIRFRLQRIGPERLSVIANGQWPVATIHSANSSPPPR